MVNRKHLPEQDCFSIARTIEQTHEVVEKLPFSREPTRMMMILGLVPVMFRNELGSRRRDDEVGDECTRMLTVRGLVALLGNGVAVRKSIFDQTDQGTLNDFARGGHRHSLDDH